MKKIALMLVAFLSFSFLLFGCKNSTSSKVSQKDNSSAASSAASVTTRNEGTNMVFVKLSDSLKCKKVSDMTTAKKVLDFINSAEKTPIENRHEAGWTMLINVTTWEGFKQYSVCGTTLSIGDSCYEVSQKFVDDLEKLYDELNYPEVNYLTN